jgi:hypothetical protein
VSVSVTVPVVLSAALGTYVAFSVVLFGEKVPLPDVDQEPPDATVTLPASNTLALLAQTVLSAPAFAVGAGVIVTTIASLTAVHVPIPVVRSVSVTVPAALSAALGTYVAFSVVLLGVKVPDPDVDHDPPEAIVTLPFSATFALLAQTVWSAPAFAAGAGVIAITIASVTAMHVPFPVVVSVNVTVPVVVSAALGT